MSKAERHYDRANRLFEKGRFRDALREFNLAIQFDPQEPDFFNDRGLVWDKLGVAERALDLLNRKRDVNVYAMTELSDSDDETDGADIPLSKRGIGYVFDDDTSLADIEEWYK